MLPMEQAVPRLSHRPNAAFLTVDVSHRPKDHARAVIFEPVSHPFDTISSSQSSRRKIACRLSSSSRQVQNGKSVNDCL